MKHAQAVVRRDKPSESRRLSCPSRDFVPANLVKLQSESGRASGGPLGESRPRARSFSDVQLPKIVVDAAPNNDDNVDNNTGGAAALLLMNKPDSWLEPASGRREHLRMQQLCIGDTLAQVANEKARKNHADQLHRMRLAKEPVVKPQSPTRRKSFSLKSVVEEDAFAETA